MASTGGTDKINIGVAGWDYRDWRGVLYPDPRPRGFDPLPWLAHCVELIEINPSFYGPPKPKTARDWLARIADVDDFHFSAKLWRCFTHERKTAWTRAEVGKTIDGLERLLEGGYTVLVETSGAVDVGAHDRRAHRNMDLK